MKTFFFVLVSSVILFSETGCLKNTVQQPCTSKSVSSEEPTILAFASANGITATRDASGLYYQIINPGSGPAPSATSKVFVTYTGKLLNGNVFDQQANAAQTGWVLGSLIQAWQIGLPLIQKGGEIKLIVPSSLAYGCNDSPLPANSILYFDIQLVDVQ
jgi:FKBP-type peptidyl-prolyl cis-trans isomerase FkpA